MPNVTRRYSREEFARRGEAFYESRVRPNFESSHQGQLVAIDIETGEFEVDANEIDAGERLRARLPEAQTWLCRIGSRYVRRFGFSPRRVQP